MFWALEFDESDRANGHAEPMSSHVCQPQDVVTVRDCFLIRCAHRIGILDIEFELSR